MKTTFIEYMKKHENRDTHIGDLARDMKDDTRLPKSNKYEDFEDYLFNTYAFNTFLRAWKKYEKEVK